MKKLVRFAAGYVVGCLLTTAWVVSKGDPVENACWLLMWWLPIAAVYYAITIVVLRRLQIFGLIGMLELCGLCVGLFPLVSGLWPTYWMRWDLALIMVVVQCVALSATVFIAYFFHRLIGTK